MHSLPDSDRAEYHSWLDAITSQIDPYDDEPPFDDGPIYEPDEADLAWLREQQDDCRACGADTAELDQEVAQLERSLLIGEVAAFLARSRDFPEQERRGAWGGHADR